MKRIVRFTAAAIQENPAIAGGICTFLVAFTLVAANALYAQPGGHPGPIFATRDTVTTNSLSRPQPRDRQTLGGPSSALSLERIPVPMMRPRVETALPDSSSLVVEAQAELARLGLYDGEIDGVYGPRTHDAVIAYEDRFGYARTGQVSRQMVRQLRKSPTPSDAGPVETTLAELPAPVTRDDRTKPVSVSYGGQRDDPALVARIQIGLINFGEGDIAVDGVVDNHTEAAIRGFQKRYGMRVDGRPSDAIIGKLEEIGALQSN
jgi:peptidoglycan hydrolase-like protein with peptidoglycan-binding domain